MVLYCTRGSSMPARENDNCTGMASSLDNSTVGSASASGGASPRGKGKALIHPQRHNLKNRFELIRTLGEGTYGKVKLASEKSSGEQVAIKYVKKTKIRDEMDLNRIRREIRIMSCLRHQHIVNIRQVFEKKDRIVLVMDCALGGELYDYLNTKRHLAETDTRRIFRQIMSAVSYIHQNGIVHRDLKLENIILDSEGNVKIADFGLANYFSYDNSLRTFCGSPLYASPEIVNGKPYHGPEVDIWSLGVVLYTLAYGAMPFESQNLKVLRQQISSGNYAEPSQPSGVAGLIRHMLTVNPARRATLRDILDHWWLNLGHELTPDGRKYEPAALLPVGGRASHRQQSSFSSDSDAELEVRIPPPPELNRVPGARCGRKSVETSFDEDEMLYDIGNSASASSSSSTTPAISTSPGPSDALQGKAGGDRHGSGSPHWSQTIANGIEEIRARVIQSLEEQQKALRERGEAGTERRRRGRARNGNAGEDGDSSAAVFGGDTDSNANPELCFPENSNLNSSPPSSSSSSPTPAPVQNGEAAGGGQAGQQDPNGDRPANVFDSDRKPKRGILKRKGKFSGGDSGCCIMEDDCPAGRGHHQSLPQSPPSSVSSASCNSSSCSSGGTATSSSSQSSSSQSSASSSSSSSSSSRGSLQSQSPGPLAKAGVSATPWSAGPTYPSSTSSSSSSSSTAPPVPCPLHHCQVPINPSSSQRAGGADPSCLGSDASASSSPFIVPAPPPPPPFLHPAMPPMTNLSSLVPLATCTCVVDMDTSKVVRRRKGILKNSHNNNSSSGSNRGSLIDDARKRLSMNSLSSNSSADILDLSYDSGDGDNFAANRASLTNSSSVVVYPGGPDRDSVSLEPGDRGSFSLDGEFTAFSLDDNMAGMRVGGGSQGQGIQTQSLPPQSSSVTGSQMCGGSVFDFGEAKQVLQQAISLIHQ